MTTLLTRPTPAPPQQDRVAPLPPQQTAPPAPPPPVEKPVRLLSLDAYRGFIMLVMASGGLAIPAVAKAVAKAWPDNSFLIAFWNFLAFHTDHVQWIGCSFWDLIQPSFMFMVGVAVPYSYAARKAKGDSDARIWTHTFWRAFLLIMLAVFLSSNGSRQTSWVFVNVLAQIGLGYPLICLLRGRGLKVQAATIATILVGYWLAFLLYPLAGEGFNGKTVGWPSGMEGLPGFFAHWNMNANVAHAFDLWFLNLFPTAEPFRYNRGGYQTLNFVPSMATMLFGLMAGELLRRPIAPRRKLWILLGAGVSCLVAGELLGWFVCPLVKRIWTPSWAIYSTGWTFLMLAAFYGVIDIAGYKRWTFPLMVVGVNSIAMYCLSQLMKGWLGSSLRTHTNSLMDGVNNSLWNLGFTLWLPGPFDGVFGPIVLWSLVLLLMWLICLWMYRRGIFLKI